MSDDLDLEDELQRLLAESGEDLFELPSDDVPVAAAPAPAAADHSKERVLSQAEIDALLASLNGD
ncbi:MAG: hypothetical protein LWX83_04760 [Anaerolineae bacterium]|nr:hypothetical protein [Anaerolineae bacterium]